MPRPGPDHTPESASRRALRERLCGRSVRVPRCRQRSALHPHHLSAVGKRPARQVVRGSKAKTPKGADLLTTRRAALTLAALLGILTGALPPAARAETVWTAVASEKIRPETAARSDRSASLAAAKNEFEAFQVVVTGPAAGVSASASELAGPGTIGAPKLFREALITLQNASAADGATGRFPDALVPDVDEVVGEKRNAFPFDVPAGESRSIWVDYRVPPDAPAGTYQGTVTVHTAQGDTTGPAQFTVWDFAPPSTPASPPRTSGRPGRTATGRTSTARMARSWTVPPRRSSGARSSPRSSRARTWSAPRSTPTGRRTSSRAAGSIVSSSTPAPSPPSPARGATSPRARRSPSRPIRGSAPSS